jgi:TRAP transporter 4TM/12TM fusion protein
MHKAAAIFNEGRRIPPTGWRYTAIALLAVPLTLFELWFGLWGSMQPLTLAIIFLGVLYTTTFLTVSPTLNHDRITVPDYILAALSLLCSLYLVYHTPRYVEWVAGISEFTKWDLAVGGTLLLLTLELTRRCVGFGMSVMVYVLLAYVFFGHHLTGMLAHREFSLAFFIEEMIISINGGLYSGPVQIAATYVFLFILFGKFLEQTLGGRFFFNLAALVAGRRVGGVSKVTVVSSGLFGMISGSPAADVMVTGSVNIPIMKKVGYSAVFAAAVEATASTGGSLVPPVMGAVVFMMVEFTGIDYAEIAKSVIIVCLLYYASLYVQVHHRSERLGIMGMPKKDIPSVLDTFRLGWLYIIPFTVLIYFLMAGYTPGYVAALSVLAMIGVSWLRWEVRVTPRRFVDVCVHTCSSLGPLIAAIAAAGFLVAALNLTGITGKVSSLIFALTGGNAFLALVAAMVITVLLGLGMPVIAVYALSAVLLAPPLVEMGLPLFEVHLFLVYYSVLSAITPPVAIAAYVASTIADAPVMPTGWQAMRIASVIFIIPFIFVYDPGLVLKGDWLDIIESTVTAFIGVSFLAIAAEGWYKGQLSWWERVLLLTAGFLAVYPGVYTDVVGILLGAALLLIRQRPDWRQSRLISGIRPKRKIS